MSKSRKFAVPGTTFGSKYVFSFNDDGKIEGVKKQSQLGRPLLSVDPDSSEFEKVTSSSQALEAYNVNNFKGRKDLYKTSTDDIEIASNEQTNSEHDKNKKKETNEDKDIDETSDNTSGVVAATAAAAIVVDANEYYYEGGTDTISFSTNHTSTTADVLTFYTESGAFSSTVTQTADSSNNRVQIASGTDILAYVPGFTNTDKIVISTATSATYTDLTSIG